MWYFYFYFKKYQSVNTCLDKDFKKPWKYEAACINKCILTRSRIKAFPCLHSVSKTPSLFCPADRENKPTLSLAQENAACACMHNEKWCLSLRLSGFSSHEIVLSCQLNSSKRISVRVRSAEVTLCGKTISSSIFHNPHPTFLISLMVLWQFQCLWTS